MRRTGFILMTVILVSLSIRGFAAATDPPHNDVNALEPVSCSSCHSVHNAQGTSLTNDAANANLCLSCHNAGSWASEKPFNTAWQAVPGISGTSHRWDATMPVTDSPDNAYGLRTTSNLSSADLKSRLAIFGDVITCSVCHNQHSQANTPWDPNAPDSGNGRHFQSTVNDINQMCEDCHYYRAMSYTRASGGDPSYSADGTNVFSHPVGEALNSMGYDKAVPLDYDGGAQQTAPRYKDNSAGDTNNTNNLVLDPSGKVRCLSCHRIHYSDSNGLTVN